MSSIDEPLPQNRMIYHKLPSFIATCCQESGRDSVKTTIEIKQNRVNQIAKYYYNQYKQNEVHNLAILVIDVSNRSDELCGQLANGWNHQKMSILSMRQEVQEVF
jgi:penicillin-binding protein 1C